MKYSEDSCNFVVARPHTASEAYDVEIGHRVLRHTPLGKVASVALFCFP